MKHTWANQYLTKDQFSALMIVVKDWELACMGDATSFSRLAQLTALIGHQAQLVIREIRHSTGISDLETRANLPSQSGKIVLPIICDFLITIQSERDLLIY